MTIAIPVTDINVNKHHIASNLHVNGCLCLYDIQKKSGKWMKTIELAENMGDLLPALENHNVKIIIAEQIHPMALKVLTNRGFIVYKALGKTIDENILNFSENQLAIYNYDTAMGFATSCGGECNSCSTLCDEDKKQ